MADFQPNVSVRWHGKTAFSVSFPSGVKACGEAELGAALKAAAKAWRQYYADKRGGRIVENVGPTYDGRRAKTAVRAQPRRSARSRF